MLRHRVSRPLTAAALALLLLAPGTTAWAMPAPDQATGLAHFTEQVTGWLSALWGRVQGEDDLGYQAGTQDAGALPTADPDGWTHVPTPSPHQTQQADGGDGETLPTADPNG